MHRFFLWPGRPLYIQEGTFSAEGEVAHQIAAVLRLHAGDRIEVLDNAGGLFLVELSQVARGAVHGCILEHRPAGGEPHTQVILYQALLKGERFEWALQKCTEVGVGRIVPVVCERSIARPDDLGGKHGRWARILVEAAEQARRGRVPVLEQAVSFQEACIQAQAGGRLSILAWEGERIQSLQSVLRNSGCSNICEGINLFTGPEGGFSLDEVRFAQEHGIKPVTLGPRILRAETAGPVATALVLYECGDMQ